MDVREEGCTYEGNGPGIMFIVGPISVGSANNKLPYFSIHNTRIIYTKKV
jgi:hypothetical protein